MTSKNTPAMDEYISKFSEDATAYHRMGNDQTIFSESSLTNPDTMEPPQLQEYGTTNGTQLFLG